MKDSPLIVHIPHSALYIPEEYKGSIVLSAEELAVELLKMTDLYTDVLFDLGYDTIIFPVSRLICDVERFRDDRFEAMASFGMGAIYTRTSDKKILKKIDDREKENILEAFYDPHHQKFEALVTGKLAKYGICLIVDAHSFPSKALPYEQHPDRSRPDFCIGSDPGHTPAELVEMAEGYLLSKGYMVEINDPFAGAIVPMKYYQKDSKVISIMIEINRSLYMDEFNGNKMPGFLEIHRLMQELTILFENWLLNQAGIK